MEMVTEIGLDKVQTEIIIVEHIEEEIYYYQHLLAEPPEISVNLHEYHV